MANTKISQLPIWTGTAADLRWFVMNNSGETETYKFSGYSTSITFGSGTDSIKSTKATASATNSIAIGNGAQATNSGAVSIGDSIASGDGSVSIGKNNSNISATGSVAVGRGCFGNNTFNVLVGSDIAASTFGITIGGNARTNRPYGITIGVDSSYNLGSYSNILGYGNLMGNKTVGGTYYGEGGTYNNVISTNSFIGFVSTGKNSSIFGGNNNTIISSGNGNTIIGGENNIISGTTSGTTLIGISNSTGPLLNDTAYVNNLQVLRTPSTQVQPISSGTTFTCNLDLGAKSQFYITGTSTINITNVRDGASFMIKTQTNGNHTMTWTATGGYTFVFEGGIKDPGNNVTDIFVFEVFGSVIYGNRRHNYS
jgi:hypothetical protein